MDGPVEDIGSRSCVTRFVKTLLSIMEHGVKPHSKHLTEYFAFLYEFAKMGEEEVSEEVLSKIVWVQQLVFGGDIGKHVAHTVLCSLASRASFCFHCRPYQQWSISTWEPKDLKM